MLCVTFPTAALSQEAGQAVCNCLMQESRQSSEVRRSVCKVYISIHVFNNLLPHRVFLNEKTQS